MHLVRWPSPDILPKAHRSVRKFVPSSKADHRILINLSQIVMKYLHRVQERMTGNKIVVLKDTGTLFLEYVPS